MNTITPAQLPVMSADMAQKEVIFSEAMLQSGVYFSGVVSASVTTPPASPVDGTAYIVPPAATGVWAPYVGCIALWYSGYRYIEPFPGLLLFVQDEGVWYTYDAGDGTWGAYNPGAGVTGPGSSVDGGLALFDGTDGDKIKGDGLTVSNDDFLQRKAGAWANRTVAQVLADLQGTGLSASAAGLRGMPINSQSGNYTIVASDAGKALLHPSGAGSGDTFTIDSNANVAFEVGTAITFVNMDSNALSIAITSDTMNVVGTGATGTRSLAQYGMATAVKITSTGWLISGVGLT